MTTAIDRFYRNASMIQIKYLLALCLLPCLLLATQIVSYPYDYTDATNKKFAAGPDDCELRVAQGKALSEYLCGAYGGNFDHTGGYRLHIFPDGYIMLSKWMDIRPKKLIGEGSWSLQGKEISIVWKWRSFASSRAEENFRRCYGNGEKFGLYLVFQQRAFKEAILLSTELAMATKIETYFRRECEYKNWQKIRNELYATRNNSEPQGKP